jgi:hypothetical protein
LCSFLFFNQSSEFGSFFPFKPLELALFFILSFWLRSFPVPYLDLPHFFFPLHAFASLRLA